MFMNAEDRDKEGEYSESIRGTLLFSTSPAVIRTQRVLVISAPIYSCIYGRDRCDLDI